MSWDQVASGTGTTGPAGPEGPAGGTAGIVVYFDPTNDSDLAGYKTALLLPSPAAETTLSNSSLSGTGYTLLASFATDPGLPGVTSLGAGQFDRAFWVNTGAANEVARIKTELYTCAADGSSETLRRTTISDSFSGTASQNINDQYIDQTGYTLAATDRFVFKVYAGRVSGPTTVTATVYFCGNTRASHAHTSAVAKTVAVAIQTTSGPTTLDITTIADGQYLKRSGTNVIGASTSTPAGFMSAIYGPGSMGDLVVPNATPISLTKDSYYQNVTIQGTGSLRTAGWKLHVAGTLTISSAGSVHDDGNAASGSTAGGALTGGSSCRGLTGAGGNGVINTVGGGAAGSTSTASALNNSNASPAGGAGGTSGAQAGGAAGTATASNQGPWGNWLTGRGASATAWTGGAGGGSGGCSTATTTSSGGGGSGGGVCWVAAKSIANSGRISCNGGTGGNATTSSGGNASGGGGGGGGIVFLITDTATSAVGTVTASGGLGGSPVGTGGASNPGVAGSTVVIGLGGT